MADLVLTPASVLPSARATIEQVTFGATITAGQAVYKDSTDLDTFGRPKVKLADANGASALQDFAGIALNGGAAGQPGQIVTADPSFTHGLAAVTTGMVIVLSGTAGALAPVADLASGMRPNVVMVANSATTATLGKLAGTANIPA